MTEVGIYCFVIKKGKGRHADEYSQEGGKCKQLIGTTEEISSGSDKLDSNKDIDIIKLP